MQPSRWTSGQSTRGNVGPRAPARKNELAGAGRVGEWLEGQSYVAILLLPLGGHLGPCGRGQWRVDPRWRRRLFPTGLARPARRRPFSQSQARQPQRRFSLSGAEPRAPAESRAMPSGPRSTRCPGPPATHTAPLAVPAARLVEKSQARRHARATAGRRRSPCICCWPQTEAGKLRPPCTQLLCTTTSL